MALRKTEDTGSCDFEKNRGDRQSWFCEKQKIPAVGILRKTEEKCRQVFRKNGSVCG